MTESELRSFYVDTARSYYGAVQGDVVHKEIVDIYNSHKPLARSYPLKYIDHWCAGFVSAMAIKCELTDIIPTEVGCGKMIDLFKKLGCWQENDAYVPNPGDVIFYDWSDSGSGDNTTSPDHVGIVVRVTDGVIRVIEGNMGGKVWHRDVPVNGKHIRGFGVPDFAAKADEQEMNPGRFKDVRDGAWYAEEVERAAELGLMVGISENEFGVGQPVTREQLAAVAVRLYDALKQ